MTAHIDVVSGDTDSTMIKHIEDNETIRKLLSGEDYSRHPLKWNIYNQILFNNLKGLCANCGKCCELFDLDLSEYDVERISKHLKLSQSETISKYCVKQPHYSFLYRFKHKPCAFLKDKRCSIYPARPNVCAFFPFLTGNEKHPREAFERAHIIVMSSWCPSALNIDVTEKTFKTFHLNHPSGVR